MKKLIHLIPIIPIAIALTAFLGSSPAQTSAAPSPSALECGLEAADATAASCGRCGDGSCVASCGETALTCPKDCGGVAQ